MSIVSRTLGISDYPHTLAAMQAFTATRNAQTADEIWLTEHRAIYTVGLNRRGLRLPDNAIPIVNVDRGGKITYHGSGQIIIYLLLDLKRRQLKIRDLVSMLENTIIDFLAGYQVTAIAKAGAPGVYVAGKKIASVGLRLKNQCCYHGLSLNVDMDLTPFQAIDPCGYAGLEMTQTKDLGIPLTPEQISEMLLDALTTQLNDQVEHTKPNI